MAFRIGQNSSNSVRKKATDAICGAVNSGSTNPTGSLLIYSGAQPATPETTASGTLLATINFASTAFTAATVAGDSGLTGGTPISATIAQNGTAGWFRVLDRDGNALFDGAITVTGGVGDITFPTTTFVQNGTVTITTLTVSSPM